MPDHEEGALPIDPHRPLKRTEQPPRNKGTITITSMKEWPDGSIEMTAMLPPGHPDLPPAESSAPVAEQELIAEFQRKVVEHYDWVALSLLADPRAADVVLTQEEAEQCLVKLVAREFRGSGHATWSQEDFQASVDRYLNMLTSPKETRDASAD